ncbi:anti-sigma factor [Pseudalkalibacillus hwajinpoensis]|uniref:Anti-sigma-W factor RsiW n=1 Tax=Guptibacillus hwajinpoensis TaxID=208199 RepID=A0A4U1MGE9_9BACL|nr:anti-sigma factor [Pseudalkalibacillus hwajinpoensis]TKD69953.1 anti-sigma factor [Pseudalkalibacillus hwajinpoensis]
MKANCEQLLDYFNGTLTEDDKVQFEAHLESCEECREELKELEELTGDLPYLSIPEEPPAGMKERVLASVFENDSEETNLNLTEENDSAKLNKTTDFKSERKSRQRKWVAPALAAALFLSLAGNVYNYMNESNPGQTEEIASLIKAVQLQPSEAEKSGGSAALMNENGQMNLVVQVNDVADVEGDQVYQVWLLEGDTPYRAGSFTPNQQGNGEVTYQVEYDGEHKWDAVAITLEPDNTSETPKGKVVLSSGL